MAGNKLRSESGASITFALLLFLVCAVLSAAILVAGTTAAGRMKGLAETDQRFYSVTSGAQLLSDMLDDTTISMFTVDGNTYRVFKPMNQVTETDLKAENMVDPEDTDPKSVAECLARAYLSDQKTTTFTITDGEQNSPLDITADMTANDEGDSTFTIYNTNGKRHYKVLLTFATDVKRSNPPLLDYKDSDTERPVTNPIEITWHADRMMSSYDDK